MRLFLIAWCVGVMQILTGVAAADGLEQRTQSFTIVLKGSVAKATPLFGPVRETEWAPHWAPRFLHPSEGAQRDGAMFTTTGAGKERLWLLTTYDVENGRVEYVVVTPGFTANEIKIHLLPSGNRQCKAVITYRHSALEPKGNEEVEKLDAQWAEQERIDWETAVNAVLVKGNGHD